MCACPIQIDGRKQGTCGQVRHHVLSMGASEAVPHLGLRNRSKLGFARACASDGTEDNSIDFSHSKPNSFEHVWNLKNKFGFELTAAAPLISHYFSWDCFMSMSPLISHYFS